MKSHYPNQVSFLFAARAFRVQGIFCAKRETVYAKITSLSKIYFAPSARLLTTKGNDGSKNHKLAEERVFGVAEKG